MTQSVQYAPIYIDSQPVDLSALAAFSQTPEERLVEFEKVALAKGDHLSPHKQLSHRSQVYALVNDLRVQIGRMRTLGCDALQIHAKITKDTHHFDRSLEMLNEHNEGYNSAKVRVVGQNRITMGQIQAPNINFTSFQQKPRLEIKEPNTLSSTQYRAYEQITKIEQEWFKKAENLPANEQADYCAAASKSVNELNEKVPLFKDADPRLLEQVIQNNAKFYDDSLQKHFKHHEGYNSAKVGVNDSTANEQCKTKIELVSNIPLIGFDDNPMFVIVEETTNNKTTFKAECPLYDFAKAVVSEVADCVKVGVNVQIQEHKNQNEAIGMMGRAVYNFVEEGIICKWHEEIKNNVECVKEESFNPNNPKSLCYPKK